MNKKLISLLLSVIMAFSCLAVCVPEMKVSAATKSELEDRIDELNDEIADNKDKLNDLKEKADKQKEYLETLEAQIKVIKDKADKLQTQMELIDEELSGLNDQIKQLNKEIGLIRDEIKIAETEIAQTEGKIAETSGELSARLRASYISGSESTFKILMGSDSLASFMTRLEMMKRTGEKDRELIVGFRETAKVLKAQKEKLQKSEDKLTAKKDDVQVKKDEVQVKKDELTAKQKEHDKTRSTLEKSYAEAETYVAKLDKSSDVYKNYIAQLEKEKKDADAQINKILSEYYATMNQQGTTLPANNANPDSGAGPGYNTGDSWAWPLGTRWCYISSKYGYRDASVSGWSFHGGIDIAGGSGKLHGALVYATRSGRVITAVTSNSGYGIYVIIDHGDGYSSLYAHMSARYVSTSDSVAKGQMIGRVGDTGNSRGAHLHFEIRKNNEKQDPLNYVRNPN